MYFRLFSVLFLSLFFSPRPSQAAVSVLPCSKTLLLQDISTEIPAPFLPNEIITLPNRMHLTNDLRIVVGTSLMVPAPELEEFGEDTYKLVDARIVSFGVDPSKNSVQELPKGKRDKSDATKITVSRSGNFIASTSSEMAMTPHFIYDVQNDEVEVRQEIFSELGIWRWGIQRALKQAMNEDPMAIKMLQVCRVPIIEMKEDYDPLTQTIQGVSLSRAAKEIAVAVKRNESLYGSTRLEKASTDHVEFSPDESLYLTHIGSLITIRRTKDHEKVLRFPLSSEFAIEPSLTQGNTAHFVDKGRHILSLHPNGRIALWDTETGVFAGKESVGFFIDNYEPTVVSPTGEYFAISGSVKGVEKKKITEIWTTEPGAEGTVLSRVKHFEAPYKGDFPNYPSVAFAENGDYLIGNENGTVRLYDIETNSPKFELNGHSKWVNSVALSADGKTAATLSTEEGTIGVWSLKDSKVFKIQWNEAGQVTQVSFSPDGKHLLLQQQTRKENDQWVYKAFVIEVEKALTF